MKISFFRCVRKTSRSISAVVVWFCRPGNSHTFNLNIVFQVSFSYIHEISGKRPEGELKFFFHWEILALWRAVGMQLSFSYIAEAFQMFSAIIAETQLKNSRFSFKKNKDIMFQIHTFYNCNSCDFRLSLH